MTEISLPSPFSLIKYESVDNTNEEAKRLARDGAPEGIVVLARKQTSGTGRRGRKWVSAIGNLYFSLVLRPEFSVIKALQLSYVASLCIAENMDEVLPESSIVNCKWPDDVLVDKRKISGILRESPSASEAVPEGGKY